MTRAVALRWSGLSLILWSICVRALSVPCRIPWWDIDPLLGFQPETTLLPSLAFALDAASWLGVACVLVSESMLRRSIMWKSGLLALVGCAGVIFHGWVLAPLTARGSGPGVPLRGDLLSARAGSAWAAAIVGAWALAHAARDRATRHLILSILTGMVAVLAIRGTYQVLVEHPRLVEAFRAQRALSEDLGVAQADSTTARIFERRLRQSEATGWFGLANVYGSVIAACLVAWFGLAIIGIRGARHRAIGSGEAGLACLTAVAAAVACAQSGSKGAMVAAALGIAILLTARFASRAVPGMRALWPLSGVALCGCALGAVVVRGIIGERIGELSILFRWHYLVGASRIITDHWLLGIGPAGFKDAYMLVRLPVAAEEVESPHSLFFDWVATIGIFGWAWALAFVTWLWRCGRSLAIAAPVPQVEDSSANSRGRRSVAIAVPGASVLAAVWIEWPALGADLMLLLVLAGAAWVLLAMIGRRLAECGREDADRAWSAAALILAVHAMIEVTGVMPGSAGWMMALLAVSAAAAVATPAHGDQERQRSSRWSGLAGATIAIALVVLAVSSAVSTRRWESHLEKAALLAGDATAAARTPTQAVDPPAPALNADLLESAAASLLSADAERPSALEPFMTAARLLARAASVLAQEGDTDRSRDLAKRAAAVAEAGTRRRPGSSRAWANLGGALEAQSVILGDLTLDKSRDAWLEAAERDPQGLEPCLHLWALSIRLGDVAATERWARRALEIDEAMRHDPLKRLTPEQRGAVRASVSRTVP